jgi:hypothetical protein
LTVASADRGLNANPRIGIAARRVAAGFAPTALTATALLAWPGASLPAQALPCITIFIAGQDELGFRNSCEACSVAVWGWGGGQSVFSLNGQVHSVYKSDRMSVKNYQVDGHGELRVRNEAATGELVREEACPTP